MSYDTRDLQVGQTVIRMGPTVAGLVEQYATYQVARFNPRVVDGLELEGVEGRWNPANFEIAKLP